LRNTLETKTEREKPLSHVASVIEYGVIVLGDHRYIFPTRNLALLVEREDVCVRHARDRKLARHVTMLNRTIFSDYHRLGSTATIIVEKGEASPAPNSDDVPAAAETPNVHWNKQSVTQPNKDE
jgi:hypothetical protein